LINSKWRKEKPQNLDECIPINNNQATKATYQMFLNAPTLVLINWLRPFVKAEDEVKEAFSMLRPCTIYIYMESNIVR
jgi:hypothetical protein